MGVPLIIWGLAGFETSKWGYPTADPELDADAPVAINQQFQETFLDGRSEFDQAGTEQFAGKEMSSLLIQWLKSRGVKPSDVKEISDTTRTRAASRCSKPDSSQSQFGGVSIPVSYDLWSCLDKDNSPDPTKYARHDFCTNSPDQFPSPGINAHFGGACSRHDMCYDHAYRSNSGYGPCNKTLYDDMNRICNSVYGRADPRRYGCRDFRDAYYAAVREYHYGRN